MSRCYSPDMALQAGLIPLYGYRTRGLESGSKPVMRHSATSPCRMTTAPGVPVEITSPGSRVMTREWNETSHHGEKIMFETVLLRHTSPFRTVETSRLSRSAISSGVTSSGPKEKKVSKLFERVR